MAAVGAIALAWMVGMTERRQAVRRLGTALLVAVLGLGPAAVYPAQAADLPSEAAYRRGANAQDAEAAARSWLSSGNLGRAINWIERMVRSPGATEEQKRWAEQQRQALQKSLHDQGFARVAIRIAPAMAVVEIDGRELAPRTDNHMIWLKEGPHHLRASAQGHMPLERDLPLSRGELRKLELNLPAVVQPSLSLQVEPPAQLWIDGALRGEGRSLTVNVAAGNHSVELRAARYANWQRVLSFSDGEVKKLQVQLQAMDSAEAGRRPVASDVNRPVLESEKNSDPLGLAKDRPVRISLPAGSKGGEGMALPAKGERSGVGEEPKGQPSEAVKAAPMEEPADPVEVAQAPAAAEEPWSDAAKGWLMAGPGLALLGGGAVMAMIATGDAEKINQRPYGEAGYDADYDAAGQRALIGYAAASVGAGLSAWGGWHLLAKRGLGPHGRGMLIGGTGAAVLAAGAWLFADAQQLSDSTVGLLEGHPEISRREELSERNKLISYAVAGTGAALIGLGAWQYWGGEAAPAAAARAWQLTPVVTPQHTGAVLALAW